MTTVLITWRWCGFVNNIKTSIYYFAQCISINEPFSSDEEIQCCLIQLTNLCNVFRLLAIWRQMTPMHPFYVTPFLNRSSFLCATWTLREGLYLHMNNASWIFRFNQFDEEVVRISHVKRCSSFSFRYLDGAESCLGSSCSLNLWVEIWAVSPMYESSGFVTLVPL